MKRFSFAVALLIASCSSAYAWGARGHEIVAIIAGRHLTPKTSEAVGQLLALDGKTAMQQVASWPDRVVTLKIPRQPSHMVLLGAGHEPYNPATDCEKNECVLSAIDADIAVLTDPMSPPDAKEMALKYLIHFVGDVHMPLHAARAGLGRRVLYKGKIVGVHFLWDNDVVDSQKGSVDAVASQVEALATPFHADASTPTNWAMESRDVTRDSILVGILKDRTLDPQPVADTYPSDNWPIARDRLNLAGRRLAVLLNAIFDGGA